jgi:hypothetical protein
MDELNTDLEALQTAVQNVVNDVASLPEPGGSDPNDAVVSSMVSALEAAGYTVTAPAIQISVVDGSEPEIPATTE